MSFRLLKYFGLFFIFASNLFLIYIGYTQHTLSKDSFRKQISDNVMFFENRFYDLRMKITMEEDLFDERLVMAAIDDDSISKIGSWPFPRSVWTEFMNKMDAFGAKVVAFDVFFSENSLACPGESPDEEFAESIKNFQLNPQRKVILPYSLSSELGNAFNEIPPIMYNFIMDDEVEFGARSFKDDKIGKRVFPIPLLQNTDAGLGFIEATEDSDGLFRRYLTLAMVDDLHFPSYSLLAYEYYTGNRPRLEIMNHFPPTVSLSTGKLLLDNNGMTKIRWSGGPDKFPFVSVYDIISASDNDVNMKKLLNNKLVFVGSTAYGAYDLRHTPIDSMLPGIYFHMNMTKMLLDGKYFKPSTTSATLALSLLISGTIFLIFLMMFNNPVFDLLAVFSVIIGFLSLDIFILIPEGYEINLFFILFSIIASYSWFTFLNFYATSKEKQKIRGTFSSFVSPAIVDQMLANPELVKVGGERKNITVFFSDIRDFTSISEKLTPEELSTCLNQYMGVMTDIIFENFGTLDKYIGDAIVAYWGAPVALENHPYHALKAGIKMIEALPAINERFKEQGFPQFEHGIGLNTGDCSVGNMGSDKIFSYTALGDQMNLGARVESLCKFYGVELNVSENTINALPENLRAEFKYRMLDKVRVKGKEQPITIYEVFHSTHAFALDEEAHQTYNKAFELYLAQEFQKAIDLLKPLKEKYPRDKSCSRVIQVCEEFLQSPPPPDWDGVFTHTTKG